MISHFIPKMYSVATATEIAEIMLNYRYVILFYRGFASTKFQSKQEKNEKVIMENVFPPPRFPRICWKTTWLL